MKRTRFVTLTGLLGAAALVLSFVETLLPLGTLLPPGVKLGLSNIVTMFAVFAVGLPVSLGIALIKAAFALVTRGAVAGFLSLAGGVLSTLIVWLFVRFDRNARFGFCGISITGALMHNVGQLCAVTLLSPSKAYLWYLPVLLLSAIAAGTVTGLILKSVSPYLIRLQQNIIREEGSHARTAH